MSENSPSSDNGGSITSEHSFQTLNSASENSSTSSAEAIASYVTQRLQSQLEENLSEISSDDAAQSIGHDTKDTIWRRLAENMEENLSSEQFKSVDRLPILQGKCSPNDPLSRCESIFERASSRSSSTDRSGTGDIASHCKAPGFDASKWQKGEEKRSLPPKGLGEAIFFSDDIILKGDKPRTRGEKFQDMNSQNTTHRRIDFQLSKQKQRYIHVKLDPASLKNVEENDLMVLPVKDKGLWFPKAVYNPKAYVSRLLRHNGGIARAVIIERLRVCNMDAPHIGQILANRNVLVQEFYPPQVTPKGPIMYANIQPKPSIPTSCLPREPRIEVKFESEGLDGNVQNAKEQLNERLPELSQISLQSSGSVELGTTGPFFPLEMFDNDMYEVQTPHEWIRQGLVNFLHYPVPARAFLKHLQLDGERESFNSRNAVRPIHSNAEMDTRITTQRKPRMFESWQDVGVRSYCEEDKVYLVSPVADPELEYRLPRIYICFRAENVNHFADRVQDAIRRRRKMESLLEYNLFVASIPVSVASLPRLNEDQVERIIASAARNGTLANEKREQLTNDIEKLHARAFAKEIHRSSLENKEFLGVVHRTMPMLHEEFHIRLPPVTEAPVPERGTVVTGASRDEFEQRRARIKSKFLLTQRPVVEAMAHLVNCCEQMVKECFFLFNMPPLELKQFQSAQRLQTEAMMDNIRGQWHDEIINGLKDYFSQAGQWYDIHVKRWDVYQISNLRIFIELTKFAMEGSIRVLLTRSIREFSEFIANACRPKKKSKQNFFQIYSSQTSSLSLDNATDAVFKIDLTISPEGPKYRTPLEQFEKTLEQIFLKPIEECHRIHQPAPRLLTMFKFPKDTYLGSLGFLDKEATVPQEKLKSAIRSALEPLKQYAHEFEQYMEFYRIDVEEYVDNFNMANYPAGAVKREIETHLKYLDKLESEIPEDIIMGPFFVDITDLKYQLVDKCQDLCHRICISFENRLAEAIREAMVPYESWYHSLSELHLPLEKYLSIVDTVDDIRANVVDQDRLVRNIQQDYELLEHFNFLISEDSYHIKYEALIWPFKIKTKLNTFLEKMEDELEKYRRTQSKDENSFQEKMSEVFAWLSSLVETQDIAKVHELAAEFRRAWKQLLEIDDFAKVLNMRQDLLKVPVTPFEQAKDLMADFEPYKDFWTTVSDYTKMLLQWKQRPLGQLNLPVIKDTFKEMFAIVQKSAEYFKDTENMLEIVASVKEDMISFREYDLAILHILLNPCMKTEHWGEFGDAIGYKKYVITEKITLKKFLKTKNVADQLELLKKINENANRECSMYSDDGKNLEEITELRDKETAPDLDESIKELDEQEDHLYPTETTKDENEKPSYLTLEESFPYLHEYNNMLEHVNHIQSRDDIIYENLSDLDYDNTKSLTEDIKSDVGDKEDGYNL